MPSIDDLLLEKKRYGLEQTINFREKWKLKKGMPVQKLIGFVELSNVKIMINKKVLIPRYETEELIEWAKKIINGKKYINVLDLCSGSGYIGIALKKWNPKLNITCVDNDPNAIKQTKINATVNNVEIKVIKSNMFNKIQEKFDLIISNPPYIEKSEKKLMSKSVLRFEPKKALFAKEQGMYFYHLIDQQAKNYITKKGTLLLEINPLKEEYFKKKNYVTIKDINGKSRFSIFKY